MMRWISVCGLCLLLLWQFPARGQLTSTRVVAIKIEHVGPAAVSDELIRANIRVKVGDPYQRMAVDDDVKNLYTTGFFYNIRVGEELTSDGMVLTYFVQGNPRVVEVRFEGNTKYSESRLRKKVTTKVGEALSERKIFTDSQEIQKMYQKSGYPRTEVNGTFRVVEATGRATVVFEIHESPKVKIERVEFVGAKAFSQKKLRKTVKTRRHWMLSWITGSGTLKDEQLEDDRERLAEFYRDKGYIDFELIEVKTVNTSPTRMLVQFVINEGNEYR
jgi:outer membrane protein insertion porin family